MKPILKSKLKLLLEFSCFGAIAGIIYQLVDEELFNHLALIMGGALGLSYGIFDLFLFKKSKKLFLKLPFLVTILIKSIVYSLIIYFTTGLIGLIAGLIDGKQIEELYDSIFSMEQIVLVIYTLTLYALFSFYVQINLLLGEGVLLKFLLGKYRKPIGENRIFMFLDLKSSTSSAEQLGLKKYFSLLNDFFHEISDPVRNTNAEIYQYVGDEVVLTWKTTEGLENSNCLKIFFKISEKVYEKRRYYREKYGEIPDFKAGIHFGKVITAQIGDIKREIIYNGDVLNTGARIQEQCNKYDRRLLISGELLNQLDIKNEYKAENLGTVKLRGKENPIELFSLVQF